jgi:arylsulfatase A-like enzyme
MTSPPNILLFESDQQRTDTMACYGNYWIKSPHLNRLADESFVFENAYVTQAVCTPARGSLMTGLYPHSHGCMINRTKLHVDIKSIAEMLPDNYRKAHFGKWHMGDDSVKQHGFDEWVSTEDDHRDKYSSPDLPLSDYYHWMVGNGFKPEGMSPIGEPIFGLKQRNEFPPEYQMAAFLANHSERFIRDNKDTPWLMVFSTFEPHPPMTGPYNGMYDPDDLPVGPAFLKQPDGASLWNRARGEHYPKQTVDGEDLSTEAGWRKLRAQYFGNVKVIDDAVGRLLDVLEETGQLDNTIIAFTTDHGEMAGDHSMLEKRAFYEESARVPMLLRVPWMNKLQKKIGGVFGHVDLVPTLLDLAGHSGPEELQGQSRVSVLKGDDDLYENAAFMEWNGIGDRNLGNPLINLMATLPWRCVVTGDRWKLNLCAGDASELFDLNNDPYEEENLFSDPAQHDRIVRMAALIRLWQHETGDTAPLPSV